MRRLAVCIVLAVLLVIPVTYASAQTPIVSVMSIGNNSMDVTYFSNISVDFTTSGYTATTGTATYNGTTYDTVTISTDSNNNGGIAAPNGTVNVMFNLVDARPFCIGIYHASLDVSLLRIYITIDGHTSQYNTTWTLSNTYHFFGQTSRYTSIASLDNASDWIQADSVINVRITDSYGFVPDDVTLDIVFNT